ncbi:hypothetical protein [Boseongicola sp. H5]|uniref:hypothetical protein n=1 Tax=Boseongicola sp. H5 TaxID=2763261 RepID=UPI001D0AD8B8|nr:hypothetical protein [Boseongicola sp. H5]
MLKTVFGNKSPEPTNAADKPMVQSRAGTALMKHVAKTDLRMGIWDQFKFDRKSSAVMAEKLGEIAVTMVEKQRAEIQQKLMLELDINKKRAYAEYMDKVGNLNQDLIEQSNLMERALRGILRREIGLIYSEKDEWVAQLDGLNLSNDDREKELRRMEEWIELAKGQVEGKVSTLVETHSTSLKLTLELLRDQAIRSDDAINF